MTIATDTIALVDAIGDFGDSVAKRVNEKPIAVAFSATPEFDAASGKLHHLAALTANVTASTIINPTSGRTIRIRTVQDAVGGWTFAVPANAVVSGAPTTDADDVNILELTYVLALTRWEGRWISIPA